MAAFFFSQQTSIIIINKVRKKKRLFHHIYNCDFITERSLYHMSQNLFTILLWNSSTKAFCRLELVRTKQPMKNA